MLENPDLANPAADRAKWEAVVHKLSAGLMPPPGEPRPSDDAIAGLLSYLETTLDATAPEPVGAPVRRLTRAAYGNAVRDLLGFPVDVESLLPADITSDGFDNVSDTLKTSPLLLERYLTVGLRVAAMAVGNTTLSPRGTEYRPRLDLSQNDWIEGLPLGTRGGLVVDHYFPTDAEYEIRPELWRATGSTVRGVEGFKEPFELQILLDGVVVHSAKFGGVEDDTLSNHDIGSAVMQVAARLPVRVRVSAGLHSVGVTFVAKSFALEQKLLDPDRADLPIGNDGYGWPIVTRVLVAGPYDSTGSGDTPTRRAIFTCRPSDTVSDTACADEILGRFALRAYGRPLDEQDRQTLRELYASGSDNGRDFEAGIEVGLARILSGPEFLLYHGVTEDAALSGTSNQDDGAMLASRLALFLWNSIPDDALRDAGIAGRLREPAALEAEVHRMLADPRADTLVTDFAEQWLQLRLVNAKAPDQRTFPTFDDNLRRDMLRETELFVTLRVARGRERARLARRRLYVPEREARRALRSGRRVRRRLPPSRGAGSEPPRLARARQHPVPDLRRNAHVARVPRQVDLDEFLQLAAATAACRRARARGQHRGQHAAQRARAPRAASQGSGVRRLSRDHRSHGARARELRRDRPLARHGCRTADRRERDSAGRHRDLGAEQPARSAA